MALTKTAPLLLIAAIASIAIAPSAFARDSLSRRLENFKRDTRAYMEHIPEKTTVSGTANSPQLLVSRIDEEKKTKARARILRDTIKDSDRPEDFVDNAKTMLTTLEEMDAQNLLEGEVEIQPWSDSYWPMYQGEIAFRYADPNFPIDSKSWNVKFKYLTGEDAITNNPSILSPAEKYDLLVGDAEKSLTHSSLSAGESYYRDAGKVETWMGICDGWSPASFMLDRPTSAVKVKAADGKTMITFYPSDIKALGSLLWSENTPDTKFVGGRCDTKKPKTDKNGRVIDQDCFDTNPATWHQAIVNQIGVVKRAFVMDSSFDYEVWNQPVKGYSYKYFNPETLKPVKTLAEATVEIGSMTDDKFADYRPNRAKYLVGISMTVDYMDETDPSAAKTDAPKNDAVTQVAYEYDLELDKNMNIIGGEWYEKAHPDFLWTPEADQEALTSADEKLEKKGYTSKRWNGDNALPAEWAEAAVGASQEGSPLATIVKALVKISRKN